MRSGQSVKNEPPSSRNNQRVLLPLEPDFYTMSHPSIVIDPPTNTWKSNTSASLKRPGRRDQSKAKHRKRRRFSSSSSSSSSSFSFLRRSRKSKKSKHSHKQGWAVNSTSGIYEWYLPVWKILLKWQILVS